MAKHVECNPLNVNKLTELSIHRSKLWSSFVQNLSICKEETEFQLADINNVWKDAASDNDNEDNLTDMESAGEDTEENLETIRELSKCLQQSKHGTEFSLYETKSNHHQSKNNHTKQELQTFLDVTLPVLDAYDRQCETSGLKQLLNTFDLKKIDEHVNGFMLRQNFETVKDFQNISPIEKQYNSHGRDSSSEESMHSVDTARYIRSCRKHRSNGLKQACTPRSPPNTMTIKTYRLVQSKREALREKYACSDEEENEFEDSYERDRGRRRKQVLTTSAGPHYRQHHSVPVHSVGRKKRFRNFHLLPELRPTGNTSDEQTDDENLHYLKSVYRPHGMCSTSKKQRPPAHRLQCYTSCACVNCTGQILPLHCNSARSVRSLSCRLNRLQMPKIREVMRESECSCCDDDTLCPNTIHLADVSTEEWVVENLYSSPRKLKLKTNSAKGLSLHGSKKKLLMKQYRQRKMLNDFDETPHGHFGLTAKKSLSRALCSKPPLSSTAISTHGSNINFTDDLNNKEKQLTKRSNKDKPETKQTEAESTIDDDDDVVLSSMLKRKHANNTEAVNEDENTGPIHHLKNNDKPPLKNSVRTRSSKKAKTQVDEIRDGVESTKDDVGLSSVGKRKLANNEGNTASKQESLEYMKPQRSCKKKNYRETSVDKTELNVNSNERKIASKQRSIRKKTEQRKTEEENKGPSDSDSFLKELACAIKESKKIHSTAQKKKKESEKSLKSKERVSAVRIKSSRNNKDEEPSGQIMEAVLEIPKTVQDTNNNNTDCAIVTSTTFDHVAVEKDSDLRSVKSHKSPQNVTIYNPRNQESMPSNSLENGQFILTEDHLRKFVGEEVAQKFFKYYVGRRQFDMNSTVYFCPPKWRDSPNKTETESDDDELENLGKYGHLIVSRK